LRGDGELNTTLYQQIEDLLADLRKIQFLKYKPNLIELTNLDIYRLMIEVGFFLEGSKLGEKDRTDVKILSQAYNKISSNPELIKRYNKEDAEKIVTELSSKNHCKEIFNNFHSRVLFDTLQKRVTIIANTNVAIKPEDIYGIKDKKIRNIYEEKDIFSLMNQIYKRRKDYYIANVQL